MLTCGCYDSIAEDEEKAAALKASVSAAPKQAAEPEKQLSKKVCSAFQPGIVG